MTSEKELTKCAHPACECFTDGREYCSQSCEEAADLTEIACQCGHPSCASHSVRAA